MCVLHVCYRVRLMLARTSMARSCVVRVFSSSSISSNSSSNSSRENNISSNGGSNININTSISRSLSMNHSKIKFTSYGIPQSNTLSILYCRMNYKVE